MSDEDRREIERKVRAGDLLARFDLTRDAIRRREGVLVVFGTKPDGPRVDVWLERLERYGKLVRRKAHAVVVLDLADLLEATRWEVDTSGQHHPFEILDLATGRALSGCYARQARVSTVQLEPFERRKAGDPTIKRRKLSEACAAVRCSQRARSGLNGLCRVHYERVVSGATVERREVTT